ncbi:MAG: tRNA epoxyqueuosine(34) reductase QueG [Cryobacterium sp.]|nr:tRNA epoxyqueuosine(34) reductase QueG [Oligoflexia bacterium]
MPTEKKPDLSASEIEALLAEIRAVGFPLVGVVDLDLAEAVFAEHSAYYAEWIAAGYQGDMGYLVRGAERRGNPRLVFPTAKSVLVAAIPYRRNRDSDPDSKSLSGLNTEPQYARYLEGPDYHTHLPELLKTALEKWKAENFASTCKKSAPTLEAAALPHWKICVDTSAVLEKSWAAITGIGWIGKNTLLIHPQLGSYLFLAVVLLDQSTGRAPVLLPNYCGNCTRCLTACPTAAFAGPGLLDSRKCISYLTLEKRGPWSPETESLSPLMGTWIAGCDVCQEVCPYNSKPIKLPETWPAAARDSALVSDWNVLSAEDETTYRERSKPSALSRIKYSDMQRNIQNAKANLDRKI